MSKHSHVSRKKCFVKTVICNLIFISLIGCQVIPKPKVSFVESMTTDSRTDIQSYQLGTGDEISIKFLYKPSLNETLKIGPDGKIHPHLIENTSAAGLTLEQLDHHLTDLYYDALGYSKDHYTLGVGDLIEIRLLYNNELSTTMPIRPDGKVLIPLIGEVEAAGRTPSELSKHLTKLYGEELEPSSNPAATVIVKEFHPPDLTVTLVSSASQKIYIGGEVAQPAMIQIQGTLRSLDALILAGGAKKTAYLETAILLRDDGSKKPRAYLLNMKKILSGEHKDALMQPYDILYIPKTNIAMVDDFMQQIYNILPVSAVFTFPYDLRGKNDKVEIVNP